MVPRQSRLGGSFRGAGAYFLFDRNSSATSERVAFTHTENVPTNDPHKALKWMAWTAINAEELKREAGTPTTGHQCSKPVFTFSLSWHPEREPQKEEMIGAGRSALAALGLEDHETLYVAHSDGAPHIHLIVNTIHPETGKVNNLSYSKLKLSRWAENYEREHGGIQCEQRAENNARRAQGEYVEYREPAAEINFKAHVTRLYHASDSGKAFQKALQQAGYKLAQGKRIVVIDGEGKLHSLSRQIDDAKAKDIRAKLADLELPFVNEARGETGRQTSAAPETQRKATEKRGAAANKKTKGEERAKRPEYFDRDAQDRAWQESILDAALEADRTADSSLPNSRPTVPTPSVIPSALLNALQNRHLAELGALYDDAARAKLDLAGRLEQQYGEYEQKLRSDHDRLDAVLKNSGRVRRWWLEVTRQIPKNAERELANTRESLKNISWRQDEARRSVEAEIERRRRAVEFRHEREKEALRNDPAHAPVDLPEPFADPSWEGPGQESEEDFGPTFE